MTLAEFKAWLEGFEASVSGAPTADQWAAIKAKLAATEIFKPQEPAKLQTWLHNLGQNAQANCINPLADMKVS